MVQYIRCSFAAFVLRAVAGGGRSPGLVQGDVVTDTRPRLKKPSMYKVLLLNDDYTPMEFVVWVLQKVFHKGVEEATRIMLKVHKEGAALCGVYTFEIAESRAQTVVELARRREHPLQCMLEKD